MALETGRAAPPLRMTEQEFEAWCDEDTRAEFVDGRVIVMSAVSLLHGEIGDFLHKLLGLYLELRPGGVKLPAEFQMRPRGGLRRVPDLMYVTSGHTRRIRPTHLAGAADSVWEIISPDSEERDWLDKFPEYEAAGIPEYWIVNPHVRTVYLYHRDPAGKYERIVEEQGRLGSIVIPGFWIRPAWLWQKPLPGVLGCLREMGAMPPIEGNQA